MEKPAGWRLSTLDSMSKTVYTTVITGRRNGKSVAGGAARVLPWWVKHSDQERGVRDEVPEEARSQATLRLRRPSSDII